MLPKAKTYLKLPYQDATPPAGSFKEFVVLVTAMAAVMLVGAAVLIFCLNPQSWRL